jgi:hypothetical protein
MRLILTALTFLWLSQATFACAGGGFESVDWGDPIYAPKNKLNAGNKLDVGVTFFIGRVSGFYGKSDRLGKQSAIYGEAAFEVLKMYTWDKIKPTEIRVHFSGGGCGGGLQVGHIALFAFKTENGKRELLRYSSKF